MLCACRGPCAAKDFALFLNNDGSISRVESRRRRSVAGRHDLLSSERVEQISHRLVESGCPEVQLVQSLVPGTWVSIYICIFHIHTQTSASPLLYAVRAPLQGTGHWQSPESQRAGATFLRMAFPMDRSPGGCRSFCTQPVKMFFNRLFFNFKIAFRAAIGSPTRAVTGCFICGSG